MSRAETSSGTIALHAEKREALQDVYSPIGFQFSMELPGDITKFPNTMLPVKNPNRAAKFKIAQKLFII